MILKKKLFKTFLFELLVMAFIPIILFTAYVHHSIFNPCIHQIYLETGI